MAVRLNGAAGGRTFNLTIQRDPDRPRHVGSETTFSPLHQPEGGDEAGLELAARRAEWHRDVLHENREALHHTATGDLPGENTPKLPTVFNRERRRGDASQVLLTMIDVGGGETLRHVQRMEPEDTATLLLELLSMGTRDAVYTRSVPAASDLLRSV